MKALKHRGHGAWARSLGTEPAYECKDKLGYGPTVTSDEQKAAAVVDGVEPRVRLGENDVLVVADGTDEA